MPEHDQAQHERVDLRELSARAETLWERYARAATLDLPPIPPQQLAKLVNPWARASARGDLSVLLRRLSWSGLDPRTAALALSALPPPPRPAPWAEELAQFGKRARDLSDEADEAGGLGDPALPFGELWMPWVLLASARLEAELGPAREALAPSGLEAARRLLARQLAHLSEMAALARLDAWREDAEETAGIYRRFVAACLDDPVGELYAHFPVLARQTVRLVRQWRESMRELSERFVADRPQIAERFGGDPPRAIVGLGGELSDRHHDGRQVLRVELDSGLRLAYKPRSVEPEAALERFFAWCREHGLEETPPAPRSLERAGYGWVEWLEAQPAASEDAAREYFRRAGALVALAHVLRGQDLHSENLVAAAGGPAIVDAEVLLQPRRTVFSSGEDGDPEHGRPASSVLATGLLTALLPDGREVRALGGLRSPPSRRTEQRVWHDVGGDGIRCEAGARLDPPLPNALWLGERLVQPEEYAEDLVLGFERAYRFLVAQRDELLGSGGPLGALASVPVRVLFRGSQEYGRVVALMAMPRNQRTGLSGSLLQEALLQVLLDRDEPPRLWPLVEPEREALERGDIPWFALPAGESRLDLGTAGAIDGFFDGSGLGAVRDLLEGLDEADLERQKGLVEQALAPPRVELGPPEVAARSRESASETQRLEASERAAAALEVARAIAGHVAAGALEAADSSTGRSGVALALAAAGFVAEDRALAHAANQVLDSLAAPPADGSGLIGAFSGSGSVVWTLSWLAELLERPELLQRAAEWARTIDDEAIARDRGYDLERGSAGAVLALLALSERSGDSRWLERAVRCGEHLLRNQRITGSVGAAWRNAAGLTQPGWMHGAAGIARALAALGERTGDGRFLVAAGAALGFERSTFDPAHGNWPMFATDGSGGAPERVWRVSVCRGAPGIALGRMLLPGSLFDQETATELLQALETTATTPPGRLQTLCCGSMGRSSVLLSAAERGAGEKWRGAAEQIADGGLLRAAREGVFVTTLDCYENRRARLGMLHGVSGIVYQLLRLSGGVHLPDLIALELLNEREKRLASRGSSSRDEEEPS